MTPTECGVVCAARRAVHRTPWLRGGAGARREGCRSCFTRGGVVRIRRFCRYFCRFVRFVRVGPITRSSERGPAARRDAGAGGAGTHDCRFAGTATIAGTHVATIAGPRPRAAAAAGAGRPDRAGPPNAAEVRGRTATEATPGTTRAARGTASATGAGTRAGTHRNYTLLVINLLYSNVQLRTAHCTSRSPIQASSPDS